MSEMPKWPTKEQYEAAWKGVEKDLTKYYQDAAFAAIPRLRVAVEALSAATKSLDAVGAHVPAEAAKQALNAIGEIPE